MDHRKNLQVGEKTSQNPILPYADFGWLETTDLTDKFQETEEVDPSSAQANSLFFMDRGLFSSDL